MDIYIVFSQTGTWLAKVLKIITKEKYVHVSLSLDDTFNNMYSFGRINPNNPLSGGFVQESFNEGIYKKKYNSECKIYKLTINEVQYKKLIEEIERFVDSNVQYKYNLIGLFAASLNIKLKRKRHYFCSQFVSEILKEAEILKEDIFPGTFKPNDFDKFNILEEEIFKGYIRDYVFLNHNKIE